MCHIAAGAAGQLRGCGSGLGQNHRVTQLETLLVTWHQTVSSPFRGARDQIYYIMASFSKPQLRKL